MFLLCSSNVSSWNCFILIFFTLSSSTVKILWDLRHQVNCATLTFFVVRPHCRFPQQWILHEVRWGAPCAGYETSSGAVSCSAPPLLTHEHQMNLVVLLLLCKRTSSSPWPILIHSPNARTERCSLRHGEQTLPAVIKLMSPFTLCCLNAALGCFVAAKTLECSGESRRRQESAAWGGLSAPRGAGVSTQLCDRCHRGKLPTAASLLHHRMGDVCEENSSEVCTFHKRWPLCCSNLLIIWIPEESLTAVLFFFSWLYTEKAFESSRSLK